MDVAVSPSPFYAISAAPSPSGENLTVLPCCNVVFLLQAEPLPVTNHSSLCLPQSHGLSQEQSLAPGGSSLESSTGCRQDSSLLISVGCKGSACRLTTGLRGMAALAYFPSSFLPNLGVSMVGIFPVPLFSQNKGSCPTCFPLKYVGCR